MTNRWVFLLVMVVCLTIGGLSGWGVAWLQDVQPRLPGPSVGKLPYLAVQVPALWYGYVTAVVFALGLSVYSLGAVIGRRRERKFGPQRLRADTRLRLRWMDGRIRELEGLVQEREAERDAVAGYARDYRSKLAAVSAALHSGSPRDEIHERRLLEGPRVS